MQDRFRVTRATAIAASLLLSSSLASAKGASAMRMVALPASQSAVPQSAVPQSAAAPSTAAVPFTADKLSSLLPATVYFQGRSAPLQLRNAAGTDFNGRSIFWASLVDTSGYSTSVQARYQFYLVSEGPLHLGGVTVPAGAYGGGFLGDRFLLMDPGGHTVLEGPLTNDTSLKRPRPLQIVPDGPSSVKLYLGRHWVLVQSDASTPTP